MIESIAEVGRTFIELHGGVEDSNFDKIVAICIDTRERAARICDEGSALPAKVKKTLYVTPPTKGPGPAPAARLNMERPERTLRDKIISWFKKRSRRDIVEILERVNAKEITDIVGNAKNVLLTVKIDGKWPAEIEWMREERESALLRGMFEGNYGGVYARSVGKGVCVICGREGEVYGFVLSWAGLKFATADKPGFFEDLDVSRAWKYVPICRQCAWNVRTGWSVLTKYEKDFRVGGLNYIVVPSKGASKEHIAMFLESISRPESEFAVFSELAMAEEQIMSNFEANVDILVYRQVQAKMEVYLLEQSVPPGVFRRIRKRSATIGKLLNFKGRKVLPIIQAYLEILNAVYSDERSRTKKHRALAQMLLALVRDQDWPGRQYGHFVTYLERQAHTADTGLDFAYRAPLFVYMYFVGGESVVEHPFEWLGELSPWARFAFWVGVLSRHVIRMQRETGATPGSEPLRKRIRSLRMNAHQLKRLYTEIVEKAKTYSEMLGGGWVAETERILEDCAEAAAVAETSGGHAPPNEIGFFFAVGYGLYPKLFTRRG